MTRAGGGWIPDGRAKAIRADCEASLAALDGLAIDLYLIHAPDPRTPWRTSVRALARLVDDGLVRRVGRLERQPASAGRGARARADRGRPGRAQPVRRPRAPRRRRRPLRRDGSRRDRPLAARRAAPRGTPRASPGARRDRGRTRRDAGRGRARLAARALPGRRRDPRRPPPGDGALGGPRRDARPRRRRRERAGARVRRASSGSPHRRRARRTRDVVLVMGIPGAGKSRVAEEYVARGYVRLNRDERGGIAARARRRARRGAVVRRSARRPRQHVPHARGAQLRDRRGAPARGRRRGASGSTRRSPRRRSTSSSGCSSASARSRRPRSCEQLARREPGVLAPTSQMRALRELEPPSADEGFAGVEQVPFDAVSRPPGERGGVFVAAAAFSEPDWKARSSRATAARRTSSSTGSPDGAADALADAAARSRGRGLRARSRARCARIPAARRPAGAGRRFRACRSPSRGQHGVDPSRSILVGTSPAHRTLATTLGARYVAV